MPVVAARAGAPSHGRPDYALSLTAVCGVVAVALVLLALLGPERRDVRFTA